MSQCTPNNNKKSTLRKKYIKMQDQETTKELEDNYLPYILFKYPSIHTHTHIHTNAQSQKK
jgi:hypothetical protein